MSNLHDRLYRNLPKSFRNEDANHKNQLKRFLEILADGGFNPLKEETRELLSLIDFDRIPAEYLPHLASSLGFEFPYDLDEQTQRTYIKNAVISYRMKGTKKALLFMIRELTKFTVELAIDEDERKLSVNIEVDPDRQDLDKMRDKVKFLVKEYAPPFGKLDIVNSFMWDEEFSIKHMFDELLETYLVSYADYEEHGFFLLNNANNSILNSLDHRISNFDQYARTEVVYDYNTNIYQTKEDDLRTEKFDDFGRGQESKITALTVDDLFFKVWDNEHENISIKDSGVTSFLAKSAIILNDITYGLNDLNRRLSDIEVLDFNEENYHDKETLDLEYLGTMIKLSLEHDNRTQEVTYEEVLNLVKKIETESKKVLPLQDEISRTELQQDSEDDFTSREQLVDDLTNHLISVIDGMEISEQKTSYQELLAVTKAVDEMELKRVISENNSTSRVEIITDLTRDFNFILVDTPTGDANYLLVGQIEQLVRNSYVDTLNYDIIETGNIGKKYTETKSMRTEETNLVDNIAEEFIDTFTYVNKNLIANTDYMTTPEAFQSTLNVVDIDGEVNYATVTRTGTSGWGIVHNRYTAVVREQQYTLSFEARTTDVTRLSYNYLMSAKEGNWGGIPVVELTKDGEWHQYSVTFTSGTDKKECGVMLASDLRTSPGGNSFDIRKVKLEEGTTRTDW